MTEQKWKTVSGHIKPQSEKDATALSLWGGGGKLREASKDEYLILPKSGIREAAKPVNILSHVLSKGDQRS